ncbi:MAG: MliC family protein [Proteobacteria bacterium]|nr:MliC family protein [Pseudomonadota bacterium]
MKAFLPLISAMLLLSSCESGQEPGNPRGTANAPVYICRDGSAIHALRGPSGATSRITIGDTTVQIDPVQAPFGAKFRSAEGLTYWENGENILLEWPDGTMMVCREGR